MKELKEKLGVKEQTKLLNKCVSTKQSLHKELTRMGLTSDNLRYHNYVNGFNRQGKVETLDNITPAKDGIPAISFFSRQEV